MDMARNIGKMAVVALAPRPYSSKIIHAGALVSDTRQFFATWNCDQTVPANLTRIIDGNLLAKSSRTRLKEISSAFRERYLGDPDTIAALTLLVHANVSASVLHPILFFFASEADPLLGDCVTDLISSRFAAGEREITISSVTRWLMDAVTAKRTVGKWSESTATRIARGLLSTLRDFDIITGKAQKRLHRPFVATPGFAFIAFALNQRGLSGDQLLHHSTWDRFLWGRMDVEAHLLQAHQENLLRYQAAGRIIRLDFPATTREEYARVLTYGAL
jgi:Putative inner membrane protein (DUF1819)